MREIKLTVEGFKFLIYNKFITVFDEEINMDLADDILEKYDFVTISAENCIYGLTDDKKEFIKHKNNAYFLTQKILNNHSTSGKSLAFTH